MLKKSYTNIQALTIDLLYDVVGKDAEKRPTSRSYDEMLVEIRKHFPKSKTSKKCLSWYRSKIKSRVKYYRKDKSLPVLPASKNK